MKKIALLSPFVAVTLAACGPTSSGVLKSGPDGYSHIMRPYVGVEAQAEERGLEMARDHCESIDRTFKLVLAEAKPHTNMYFVGFRCLTKVDPEPSVAAEPDVPDVAAGKSPPQAEPAAAAQAASESPQKPAEAAEPPQASAEPSQKPVAVEQPAQPEIRQEIKQEPSPEAPKVEQAPTDPAPPPEPAEPKKP